MEDGRYIAVEKMLFGGWALHVDNDEFGHAETYSFNDYGFVMRAFHDWSGEGDPEKWIRHIPSNRRRDLLTGEEWINP
jgi:hypothetical protein